MGNVSDREKKTVALLGGDTIVGHALSLLLGGAGYEVRVLEAPITGRSTSSTPREALGGVDVLLISPGLANGRREQSLAALRGERETMGIPVLELSSAIKEGVLHKKEKEVGVVPWPINIEGLVREIEGALEGAIEAAVEEVQYVLGDKEPPLEPPLAEGEAAL
jgi:hypothetical protein